MLSSAERTLTPCLYLKLLLRLRERVNIEFPRVHNMTRPLREWEAFTTALVAREQWY